MPTTKRQLELFNPADFVEQFVTHIDDRLPEGEWLEISDIALAFDVCNNQVHAWREEGMIQGFNKGAKGREYWRIWRPSVLNFARMRAE